MTLLLQRRDGTWNAGTTIPCGREPSDLEAVDVDRDGDPDLVVANHETSNFTVLRNDGHGGFVESAGSTHDTGARPHVHGVAVADFDADGWPDVAVESADTREVRIVRGGSGGLSKPLVVPIGTMPYSRIAAGDWNGDGTPELFVPGNRDNTIRIVEHRERGFVEAPRARLSRQPWAMVAADLNADGRSDVVSVETDGVSLWISTESGLRAAPGSPHRLAGANEAAVGDLDGDGVAEVVVGLWEEDQIHVLDGRSRSWYRTVACTRPVGFAIADLDGDGREELLAACATGDRLLVLTSKPDRTDAPSPGPSERVEPSDRDSGR